MLQKSNIFARYIRAELSDKGWLWCWLVKTENRWLSSCKKNPAGPRRSISTWAGVGLRPQLCWQFVQTCLTGRFAFVVLLACLSTMSICSWTVSKNRPLHVFFLAAQGFHVESNVKSVILVRRKGFLLKKQPIQLFLSYMGKSTQAWYCSCFAFKKTLHLSLFGPATTGILA